MKLIAKYLTSTKLCKNCEGVKPTIFVCLWRNCRLSLYQ